VGAFRIADKAVAAAPVTDAAGANVYELGAIDPAGRVHVTLQEVDVTVARSTVGLIGVGGRRVTVIVFEAGESPPCRNEFVVAVTAATFCDALTVYVPLPPVPVRMAVMVVFAATPTPEKLCPTTRELPAGTLVAVSVVPEMAAVNEKAGTVVGFLSSACIKTEYVCPAFRPVIVPVRFVEPVIAEVASVPVTDVPVAGVAVYVYPAVTLVPRVGGTKVTVILVSLYVVLARLVGAVVIVLRETEVVLPVRVLFAVSTPAEFRAVIVSEL